MKTRKLVAARDFRDAKNERDYKAGDRIEVDDDYGQELIRQGQAKDDSQATQQPAQQNK